MKRNSFTLFEILIALPLVALLLSFLIHNFSSMLCMNQRLEKRYEKALERHYFQRRFQQFLARADKKKQKVQFFQKDSLEFEFNNGVSVDEKASGKLHAHFFYDPSHRELALDLFKNKERIRHEVLLTHVEGIQLEYSFEHKNPDPTKPNPFIISHDPQTNPQKWVAVNAKVVRAKNEESYFFLLKRSLSPQD